MFSGNNILYFAILENLRIFQNCLFTCGVVAANGIYSAAFCESAALRRKFFAEFQRAELPQSKTDVFDSSLGEGASGAPASFAL